MPLGFESNSLIEHEFIGTVLPDLDPLQKGRYRVHIPELMQHISEQNGIWCKNHVHAWRITPSADGEYGSYFPLHADTKVIIKFYSNDINTGYICRIISDALDQTDKEGQDAVTVKPSLKDRDEQYIIFKTPKKFNVFYANEETENEPNTIYLVYNRDGNPERRTVYRIDESGIHLWTRDNRRVRILLDENRQIDGNQTEYIKLSRKRNIGEHDSLAVRGNKITNVIENEDRTVYKTRTTNIHENEDKTIKKDQIENVEGNKDNLVKGNLTIQVQGECSISVDGKCNIWSGSEINAVAPMINLNCGTASKVPSKTSKPAEPALPKTTVRDLGPGETEEYDLEDSVGDKCDDATKRV
jgi:hypothetical protein